MKRILDSERLLGVTQKLPLADLKLVYRKLIKEWHPDKLQNDAERLAVAEVRSKEIIDAYHFLVSIHAETREANAAEYNLITTTSLIKDFEHKGLTLKIIFQNGSVYEYFGVTRNIYIKMVNSPTVGRFARRHIYFSYTYRIATKETTE